MKKKITTLFLLALGASVYAQTPGVGIGTPLPDQSAMLDISATDKGVLIPRVALTDKAQKLQTGVENTKSLLVFNSTVDEAKGFVEGFYFWNGTKWEEIVSSTLTDKILDRITTIEIENGKGPEGTGGGNTVIYKPGKDGAPGTIVTIVKEEDGTVTETPIDVADLIRGQETNTFIKEFTVNKGSEASPKNETALYYFNEAAIQKFIDDTKTKKAEVESKITVEYGEEIKVLGVVSKEFERIIENNKEEITKIINNIEGAVTIVNNGTTENPEWILEVGTGDSKKEFDINNLETRTYLEKSIGDGENATVTKAITAPTNLNEKGKIYYTYFGEDKNVPYYIDVTSDVLTSITNPAIKEKIISIVNNPGGDGDGGTIPGGGDKPVVPVDPTKPDDKAKTYGNVYYGPMDPTDASKGDVLYSIDKAGIKHYIDISQNVINEITNNPTVIEKIKEVTTVKVIAGNGDAPTGEVVGGETVYKGIVEIEVKDPNDYKYDSKPTKAITVKPSAFNAKGEWEETGEKFSRLLSVKVLTKGGQLVIDSATDVTAVGDGFDFYFGVGNLYTPIADGTYDLIFEYTAKK